ncbi:MAG: type II toxin-antitoxin system Phd/YefM family antitoxin [Clostridia bacterium]
MPQIIPIRDLKNTAVVSEKCKNANEPIFVTKNGYGDMVLMSMRYYEETFAKMQVAKLLNESIDDVKNGAEMIDGDKFFEKMREKHAK